jgi:DNA-binding response OmpR family regulator
MTRVQQHAKLPSFPLVRQVKGESAIATVLVVDKDPLELELMAFLLKHDRHNALTTVDPEAAFHFAQTEAVDLVVVEIVHPRYDGHRVCQQLHQLLPRAPLIIVSELGGDVQIVRGLLAFADDYIVKPFSAREFLARVHAALRRTNMAPANKAPNGNLCIGEVTLNLHQMHAIVNGKRVPLTPRELALLDVLMNNANRVLTRGQLTDLAWGDEFTGSPKTVDVCMQRLRKKLLPHLHGGSYIHALRGFGYKFEKPRDRPKPMPRLVAVSGSLGNTATTA